MVGRFVQQQDVRRLHQRLDDGQALLPASGECGGFCFQIFKTGAAQGLGKAGSALRLVYFGALQGVLLLPIAPWLRI